jgi:hypothetical protein
MKIKNIYSLFFLLLGALAFTGCEKDDGAVRESVKIDEVPTITTNVDPSGSLAIDMLNLSNFSGKFKMDLYFPGTTPPTKVDIMVRKNGSNSNVRLYKADVTTFPANYTITAAELATLFGAPIALGDSYDFAPDIYVGSKKFEAFPATGPGTGTWAGTAPGFGEFARFAAICAYDPTIYTGNFVVVSDAFGELTAGTVVTLSTVSPNSFRMTYPNPQVLPTSPVPSIVVTVNTGNNNLSSTQQQVGTNFYQYTNPSLQVAGGSVAPCDKRVTLNITYRVAQGSFGSFNLVLRAQ